MVTTVKLQEAGYGLVDINVYRQQIYNFLQSVTIKYEPLIEGMSSFSISNGVDESSFDQSQRKYYLNMCGKYSLADKIAIGGTSGFMQVISLDTQEPIDFTVESLEDNPVTRTNYLPGTTYYTELCQRYPNHTDLIRGILFPVKDVEAAIDAPNLTLLNYDASALETTEVDNIIEAMKAALAYISRRWDFPPYGYEPYYHWTFWALLVQSLASVCFMSRFRAIRKYGVHSFHVWSYLRSKGLDDYSDILTYQQSMFLYKNLDYITQNRGKEKTLKILATELLLPLDLAIYGRDVYQESLTGNTPQVGDDGKIQPPSHELTPEFVAKEVLDGYAPSDLTPPMSMLEMEEKLQAEGNEVPTYSLSHEQDVVTQTTTNTYPTKVLELTNVARNKRWVDLFNTYLLDTLFYSVANNHYDVNIEIPSKNGSSLFVINAKEALIILNYAMCKSQGWTPELIPTGWNCVSVIKPYPYNLPDYINYRGDIYRLNSYVNFSSYLTDWRPNYNISKPLEMSDFIGKGLELLINQISQQRLTADGPTSACMRYITDAITLREMIPLNLSKFRTYKEFFGNREDIYSHVIEIIEASSSSTAEYDTFANDLLNTLVPITDIFRKYGDFALSEEVYARIKDLFVQLTSYNINFINDTSGREDYFYLPHFEIFSKMEMTQDPNANFDDGNNSVGRLIELGTPLVPYESDYRNCGLVITYRTDGSIVLPSLEYLVQTTLETIAYNYIMDNRDLGINISKEKMIETGTRCMDIGLSGSIIWPKQE